MEFELEVVRIVANKKHLDPHEIGAHLAALSTNNYSKKVIEDTIDVYVEELLKFANDLKNIKQKI